MGKAHRLAARRRVLLRFERELWSRGVGRVCGVDEAGVGPLAGPLVAGAVILPVEVAIRGVDDSKKLSATVRARLVTEICEVAIAWAVGIVSAAEVDRLNPYHGALEAMRRAVAALERVPRLAPEHLLVDAREIPGVAAPQQSLIRGDGRSLSIAAASIVAKEHRDSLMREVARAYPGYGFERHMGYGTRVHLEALERLGPCPEHRTSFAPVRNARLRRRSA